MTPFLLLRFIVIVATLATITTTTKTKRYYNGDQVLRLFPATKSQFDFLKKLFADNFCDEEGDNFVDFWSDLKGVGIPADLYVRHDKLQQITSFLDLAKIGHSTIIDDVQKLIDKTEQNDKEHQRRRRRELLSPVDIGHDDVIGKFASYAEMMAWLEKQCATYPKLTECGSYGTSWEGRDLRFIRIGFAKPGLEKRSFFIEGGIHAREWLSPATVMFLINKFLTAYQTDDHVKQLLHTFEFFIIPLANPDGYEYSRTKERLWRKTRSNTTLSYCFGVDGNRNYPIRWSTSGSEAHPCSNIYHGPHALSEPETKAITELILRHSQNWLAYFSIHSYSQFWLIPYGFYYNYYPKDYSELLRVAHIGASALMAENGGTRTWEIGNTVNLTYACSGSSDDWAKAIVGVKYTFTLELFPSSTALTGFVVGEQQIEPSGREVFAGLLAAINAMEITTDPNVEDSDVLMTPEEMLIFKELNPPSTNEEEEFSFTVNELGNYDCHQRRNNMTALYWNEFFAKVLLANLKKGEI